ncbi:MAG: hypothetical protein LBK95_12335 [Bifidobacteriaceae bacterium]|nr:hypothetical protein [Bifidobacteriaceae bacterium]
MAEITPEQVHDLLTGTHEFLASTETATKARDQLARLFLDVARQAKAGLRDLSAVSGLHHATIRAMIQRATGPGLPDGWDQPELPILADLDRPFIPEPKRTNHAQSMPPSPVKPIRTVPVIGM